MKKLCLILFALIFANVLIVSANAAETSYVFDYANVLNEATEGYISENGKKLYSESGINVTVMTVKDKKIDDLNAFFERNVKMLEIDKGVVILVAEKIGGIATYTTSNMKHLLSDEKLKRIREDCVPGLQDGVYNFDKAIDNLYRAVLVELDVKGIEKPLHASREAFMNFCMIIPIILGYCFIMIVFFELVVKKIYRFLKKKLG